MKNKKGHVILGLSYVHLGSSVLTITAFKIAFMAIVAACVWHIPAWERAKATHTEAEYQAQKMFPQQLFDKLPGVHNKTVVIEKSGNEGNLPNGIQK